MNVCSKLECCSLAGQVTLSHFRNAWQFPSSTVADHRSQNLEIEGLNSAIGIKGKTSANTKLGPSLKLFNSCNLQMFVVS